MYYENFLNSITPDSSYIPESATLNDYSIFTNRAIQDSFNEAFISVAMQEMTMFSSVVNEADDAAAAKEKKQSLLKTIAEWFKKAWAAIKGFFARIIDGIKKAYTKFKIEKGKVLEAEFDKALKICTEKKDDTKYKVFPFSIAKQYIETFGKEELTKIQDIVKEVNKKDVTVKSEDLKNEFSKDNIAKRISNNKANNWDDYTKALEFREDAVNNVKGKNYSEETVLAVNANKKLIVELVFKPDTFVGSIKQMYNHTKNMLDLSMSTAKEHVNRMGTTYSGQKVDVPENVTKGLEVRLSIFNSLLQMATKIVNIGVATIKKCRSSWVSCVAGIITRAKRIGGKEEKKSTNESALFDKIYDFFTEGDEEAASEEKSTEDSVEDVAKEDVDIQINTSEDEEDGPSEEDIAADEAALFESIINTLD